MRPPHLPIRLRVPAEPHCHPPARPSPIPYLPHPCQGHTARLRDLPLLFNIALLQLPSLLNAIPGIHYALYADDLTIWTTSGSSGAQQDALQQAIDTTVAYLHPRGLTAEPSKSALLVLRARTRGRPPQPTPDPQVTIHGTPIPQVTTLRVLGVPFHYDGSGAALLPQLHKTITQLTHLIRRIRGSTYGLKEPDTCKLVQALLISRLTYSCPFVNFKIQEANKLDALIRKSYKAALGLPTYTSNTRLLQLGLHNTLTEILEAQRTSHLHRLSLTPAGRRVLQLIGRTAPATPHAPQRIPLSIRQRIHVHPVPKHMHPFYNQGRRNARVRLLDKRYGTDPNTRYTDIAQSSTRHSTTIAVLTNEGRLPTAASYRHIPTPTAESLAIAHAALTHRHQPYLTIITDSQQACRLYQAGLAPPAAIHLLQRLPEDIDLSIVWTPGHSGLAGNEAAHAAARALITRALPSPRLDQATPPHPGPPALTPLDPTYNSILSHYTNSRRRYPPPHPSLTAQQAYILRRLQTETYYNHIILSHISPSLFPPDCPHCHIPLNTYHLVFSCPQHPHPHPSPSPEQWESELTSSAPERQVALVRRALEAARTRGLLDLGG